MKKTKILYWTFTGLIVLLDGVIPALTSNSDLTKKSIIHLGYPDYFRVALTFFKVTGALILILPVFKARIKEWAYAGFAFDFLFAAISVTAVDGFGAQTILPMVALSMLALSYYCYHKLHFAANKSKDKDNLEYPFRQLAS
jgi:hypothetical protein